MTRSRTTAGRRPVLAPARPAPLPAKSSYPDGPPEAQHELCAFGEDCVAYPALGTPARLSRHNTARFRVASQSGGGPTDARLCYGCRSVFAELSTASQAARRRPARARAATPEGAP